MECHELTCKNYHFDHRLGGSVCSYQSCAKNHPEVVFPQGSPCPECPPEPAALVHFTVHQGAPAAAVAAALDNLRDTLSLDVSDVGEQWYVVFNPTTGAAAAEGTFVLPVAFQAATEYDFIEYFFLHPEHGLVSSESYEGFNPWGTNEATEAKEG